MAMMTREQVQEINRAYDEGIIPASVDLKINERSDAYLEALFTKIKRKRAEKTRQADLDVIGGEEGGLFNYDMSYQGEPRGTISKGARIDTPKFKEAYARQYGIPMDSVESIDINERILDDPIAMTNYVMQNGLNNDMTREEVAQKIATAPRLAKAEILDKGFLSKAVSLGADALSGFGRSAMGLFSDDPLTAMGQAEPHSEGFIARTAEGILKSPITPISLGSGALLNASSKLGLAGQSALIGGAEGLAEEGVRQASGESSGDYLMSGGAGLLGGAVAPFAEDVVKRGVGLGVEGLKKGVQGTASLLGGEKLGYGVKEALSSGSETVGDASAIQTAKELGISTEELPMSITHGTNSANARAERTLAQDSDGQKYIDKYDNAFNVVDNKINETSGILNAQTPEEAGTTLINGLEASRNNLFNKNTETFNSVLDDVNLNNDVNDMLASEYAPNLQEKMFYEIDKIDRLLDGSIEPNQIQALGKAKDVLTRLTDKLETADEGGNTYEILNNIRTSLGAIAYDKKLGQFELPSSYIKTLKDTERDVSKTLTDAITGADPTRGELLKSTNKAISEHFANEKELGKLLGADRGAEKAFNSIFNDSKRTRDIKQMFEVNGQREAFERARDSWFNKNILKKNADGETLYKSSLKQLNDKKDLLKAMYGDQYENFVDQQKKLLNFGSQLGARFHQGSAGANEISMQGLVVSPIKKKIAQTTLGAQRYDDIAKARGLNPLSTSNYTPYLRGVSRGAEQQGIFDNWIPTQMGTFSGEQESNKVTENPLGASGREKYNKGAN